MRTFSQHVMPVFLALVCLGANGVADELLLRQYAPITVYKGFSDDLKNGESYTYMDVEDTYISKAQPAANHGGDSALIIADPADAILIAFKQLNRAVPVGSTASEVELWLAPKPWTETAPDFDPNISFALYRVTAPWRDGYCPALSLQTGFAVTEQRFATNYEDRFTGEGVHRRPWKQPGGRTDIAEKPALTGKLGDFWDPQRRLFILKGPGLAEDVRYWLARHSRNYGWMLVVQDGLKPPQRVALVSSDALELGDPATSGKPTLRIVYEPKKLGDIQKPDLPDLDVTYIERTPRYTRYHDNGETSYERKMFRGDNVGIMKKPDYADEKKWPDAGERVTFTAHVKNAGTRPVPGPVAYRWLLNDQVVKEGTFDGQLAPWAEWTATYEWAWAVDHQDHRNLLLEFEVDPQDTIKEITKNNNLVAKYIGAKALKYWVEKSTYEYVKNFPCALGSYSFEDYLQWHFSIWNETYFDKSRFDGVAPDGCLERTTLDDFGIVADGVLQGGIHRPHDKWDPHFDGEWGTTWEVGKGTTQAEVERGVAELVKAGKSEEAALEEYRRRVKENERNFLWFLRTRRVVLEGSLLHEASHQTIGAYDIYWSNIEASSPTEPNGKCKLKDETGFYVTRGSWYAYGGLMGGSDTRPNRSYWTGTGLYELNTVGGVNTDLPYRNGFYGDWQYDLPQACYVCLSSPDGKPLAGAKVSLWQTHSNTIDDAGLVAKDLAADADGVLMLPYQDSLEDGDYTTLTGHTFLKKNPFGRPDVVGENITLLLRIDAYGQRDYKFVRVIDFNNFYWLGQRDKATLPLKCRICPSDKLDLKTNVALGAKVRASTGAESAEKLVDGNVETAWEGGATKSGDWLEIELPSPQRVGLIQIVQDGAHGPFYQRFRITTRPDATAVAEPFATQAPDSFSLSMANDKDANNQRPSEHWVTYAATARPTRVIRIEALDGGAVRLSEMRVFAEK